MRGLAVGAVLIGLASCVQNKAEPSGQCNSAGSSEFVPRDPDAGPQTVTVGDAAPPSNESDAAPDPNNWHCELDEHCAVFAALPYCDGASCSAPERTIACTADAKRTVESVGVKHTYVGTNGTVTDTCDANGNLADYACETEWVCTGSPNPYCAYFDTGRVLTTTAVVDCAGTCFDGRCDGRCPQQGDHITFQEPDGSVVIHNDTDGRTYECMLEFDTPADDFDCESARAMQMGLIVSRSVADTKCTGANFGGIGVILDGIPSINQGETCSYQCGIRPESTCPEP